MANSHKQKLIKQAHKFTDKLIKQSLAEWQKTDSLGRVLTHPRYRKDSVISTKQIISSWQNEPWPISGKYKNTKLKDLPLSYLEWVGMNFDINSKGYKLAVQELECRTNNT